MSGVFKINGSNDEDRGNFTPDQYEAVSGIIDFIAAPFDPGKYMIGLAGAGGTGKTYVTNTIINKCKYSASVIKCASPTHKACRIFSGAIGGKAVETIQSVFGLRLDLRLEDFDPSRPQFNPMAKVKLDNIKLLIIDEASMLPSKLVTYVRNMCKKLEIKVIFIGDSYQLAPVNEKCSIAFNVCAKVYHLTTVVRQGVGNPISDLLVILRKDIENKSYNFLSYVSANVGKDSHNHKGEGYAILNPKDFQKQIDTSFSNDDYSKNIDMYRIIGYTNDCVSGWNNYIRNSIIIDAEKNIITKNDLIMSYETIVNEFMEIVLNNSEEYIIHDITNYVDPQYEFKGFLIRFQLVHGGIITKPLFVIDHRDRASILMYHKVISSIMSEAKKATAGNRGAKWKDYYSFKKKYLIAANIMGRDGRILYKRDIDYGFSITAHKSQGSTYGTNFVDINNMIFDKNGNFYSNQDDLLRRLYVACSRPKERLILSYGK